MANASTNWSKRTANALRWRFTSQLVQFVMQFGFTAILARLLPVSSFGILSQALIVTGFTTVFMETGIVPALIQRAQLTDRHIKIGYTFSVATGTGFTIVLWCGADHLARFFGTPALGDVVRLLAAGFLVSAWSVVPNALLQRRLEFRRLFWINFSAYLIGYGFVGLPCALIRPGVWALAFANLTQLLVRSIFTILSSPEKPSFGWNLHDAKELLSVGVGFSFSRFCLYGAQNGDYAIVGRTMGADALALYGRAYTLMMLPIAELSSVITSVLFPAFSEIQNDDLRIQKIYKSYLALAVCLVCPVFALMFVLAEEILAGIFGAKWLGAVSALKILCIGGLPRAVGNLSDSISRAKGAIGQRIRINGVYAVMVIVCSFIGSRWWGLNGVAIGVVLAITVQYYMMASLSVKLIQWRMRYLLLAHVPGLCFGAIVLITGYWLKDVTMEFINDALMVAIVTTLAIVVEIGILVLILYRVNLPKPVNDHVELLSETVRDLIKRRQ